MVRPVSRAGGELDALEIARPRYATDEINLEKLDRIRDVLLATK